MFRRTLLLVLCAVLALPVFAVSQQKKQTDYVFWQKKDDASKTVFVSLHIAEIESDHGWDKYDLKYNDKCNKDFTDFLVNIMSEDDLSELSTTFDDIRLTPVFGEVMSKLEYALLRRTKLIERWLEDGWTVYSVDFRYSPRKGEVVSHINPLSPSESPPYARGIITKKRRR